MTLKKGSTRWVILIGKLALKIPSLYSWRNFLWGLLANMQEVEFSRVSIMKDKLCPIRFHLPLGFFVVMPRARVLYHGEISKEDLKSFCDLKTCVIPAELKYNSFGYYKGNLVAIDYG